MSTLQILCACDARIAIGWQVFYMVMSGLVVLMFAASINLAIQHAQPYIDKMIARLRLPILRARMKIGMIIIPKNEPE